MDNNNLLFYRKYFQFEKAVGDFHEEVLITKMIEAKIVRDAQGFNNKNPRDKELAKSKAANLLNADELIRINKQILSSPIHVISDIGNDIHASNCSFSLFTQYPGLILGTGYSHDFKGGSDEVTQQGFKIGFYFDYTTGMPLIPGSSVKGALRSLFPQKVVGSKNSKKKKPKYATEKNIFIKKELESLGVIGGIDIDLLEREIFDGLRPEKIIAEIDERDDNGKLKFKPFSIYQRDIFWEAVPVKWHNKNKRLFEDDSLAVHKANLLKNPVPIKFLKVAPNVEFRFQFKLFDSILYPVITKEIKKALFKKLLLTFGIGAKTNVGYGQFSDNPMKIVKNEYPTEEKTGDETYTDIDQFKLAERARLAQEKNATQKKLNDQKQQKQQRDEENEASLQQVKDILKPNVPYIGKISKVDNENNYFEVLLSVSNIVVKGNLQKLAKKGYIAAQNDQVEVLFDLNNFPKSFSVKKNR